MSANTALKDFDLNLIKVLDAVISAGNATKASKRLQVTPAAVSLALQRLQNSYSDELFIRTKDGLVPTSRALEIHHAYSHVLEIVASTLEKPLCSGTHKELTILGNDINEQYYLSQLFQFERFAKYLINYCSNAHLNDAQHNELLMTGAVDIILTLKTPSDSDIQHIVIEHFRDYCVICGAQNPLSELSTLSLHNFFSFPHAVYRTDPFGHQPDEGHHIILPAFTGLGRCRIGYRTDSLNGLICIVENSDCIAVLPCRIARFLQQQGYRIALVSLPDELEFKATTLLACWNRKNKQLAEITEIITMMQTLSSFRK